MLRAHMNHIACIGRSASTGSRRVGSESHSARLGWPFVVAIAAWTVLTVVVNPPRAEAQPHTDTAISPWDLRALEAAPKWTALERPKIDGVKALTFEGLPFQGRPTRVFAWLGLPERKAGEKVPAMVLVHGGGGTAFEEWVRLWVGRGYAAIALDTCGQIPVGHYGRWFRDGQGGPPGWGGFDQMDQPQTDQWTYHAVADIILAHSLIRSMPEVDPERTGVTGISWGGYLTCIVAGVDSRFKLAVPVYGCGFYEDTVFEKNLGQMSPEAAARWLGTWDPSVYLPRAAMPILWVNGSNDFAYPLSAMQQSYRLPKGPRTLCVRLRMPHGHGGAGENPEEIRVFVDSVLKGGTPLVHITGSGREGRGAWASYASPVPVVKAELNFTRDTGRWQDRTWEARVADCADGRVSARLPEDVRAYYFNLYDERGCVVSTEHETEARLPGPELNLRLEAPVKTWDEAVPLGNGAMGVLLWGETNLLRLSLDRGDLWDERPSKRFTEVRDRFNWRTMQGLVASNRMAEFNDIFDSNYDYNGPPTKLPAGRVEITLDPAQTVERFELDLASAEGRAHFKGGAVARAFVDAASVANPVALVRIDGPPLAAVRLQSPESVKKLGYPPPRTGEAEGLRWFDQEAADGFAYAICVGWKRAGDATLLAVTVATRAEGKSPQAVARTRVEQALKAGYDGLRVRHARWWAAFWERSRVSVPEPHILEHYHRVRYFYGAASRRGAPPMPLQGVWSADAGTLPPWKGDYHNDLNTQMTYLAYRASGDFDEGLCFLEYLWDRLPTFRKFAKDVYDTPGAAVPGVMSLAGQPLGGWGQYSLSPTMGAWNAHLFYLHWRHTGDNAFLRDRAYPFCREIAECLRALLKPDTNGVLVLPLSSSPEIFDNTRRAFLQPNSNYDLASLKMLFLALAEMAQAVGDRAEVDKWLALDRQLGDWHLAGDQTLLLDATTPLPGSHRHLSNLMPLHPFNLITAEGGERDRQIIAASLKDWDNKGTSGWCGYSFSWMACLRARVGDAEAALRHLDIYARAFILRNGFHANGDQTKSGYSSMTYRPFTLEGNFLAMDAVHEMLLQSWSPSIGQLEGAPPTQDGTLAPGPIRLFPATPWRWHDASFDDLRAEGGHRVSARRENNATTWFRIVAGRDGLVRVRDNFGGREPRWSNPGVRRVGDTFELAVKRGEAIEATLPKPKDLAPAPADAAEPVVIRK